MARALEYCADHGGVPEVAGRTDAHREGAAGQWRNAFIRSPYGREKMTPRGIISDTFETAITWDRFETFHDQVKAAAEQAIRDATGRPGQVTCRCTHVYPDGPAPYFSFHALGRHGALIEQWQTIKTAASDAVIIGGGTITHHHAMGRDHRPPVTTANARTCSRRANCGQEDAGSARYIEPGSTDRSVVRMRICGRRVRSCPGGAPLATGPAGQVKPLLQTSDWDSTYHQAMPRPVANAALPEKAGITSFANRRRERNVSSWGKVPHANAQIT